MPESHSEAQGPEIAAEALIGIRAVREIVMELRADTSAAFPRIIEKLRQEPVTRSRYGDTRELLGVTVRSPDPRSRWLDRDDSFNLAFALQETFAYWRGLNPGHVQRYNTNMEEWIDEETGELPGSAYGDRMRHTAGHDQIERAVDQLRDNPESRRAVIQVHQASVEDYDGGDVSCTAHLHPFVRDGELHMHAVVRSQDMYWGYPYDVQNNQAIQELLAGRLGVGLGEYVHVMESCHFYTDMADDVAAAADRCEGHSTPDMRLAEPELETAFQLLDAGLGVARAGGVPREYTRKLRRLPGPWADWLRVMTAYEQRRFHDDEATARDVASRVTTRFWRDKTFRRL